MVPFHIYCNCYNQEKYRIWETIIHSWLDGCDQQTIVDATGIPMNIVVQCLDDLYIEDKIYPYPKKNGRWYPEMGVS